MTTLMPELASAINVKSPFKELILLTTFALSNVPTVNLGGTM